MKNKNNINNIEYNFLNDKKTYNIIEILKKVLYIATKIFLQIIYILTCVICAFTEIIIKTMYYIFKLGFKK